jgi:histone H3/H4
MMAMAERTEENEAEELEETLEEGEGERMEEAVEESAEEPAREESAREEIIEEASSPEEESRYAFPEAAVVRVMKRYLDKEKMVKKEVKIAMNQWLEKAAMNIAKEMNKVPYVMVTLNEFKQGVKVYDSLEEFDMEKQRILAHMEAIKKDIERLERDLGKLTFNPDGVRN